MSKKDKPVDWEVIREEYCANILSVAELARKYGVNYQTLNARAKRKKWVRIPKSERADKVRELTSGKRERVNQAVSVGKDVSEDNVEQLVSEAVDQDVEDMNLGLDNSRKALKKASEMIELAGDCRDLKVLTDVTKSAVDTIRKIRGLDEKDQPEDYDQWTIQQLQDELERLQDSD